MIRLRALWWRVTQSLWFLPTLLVLGGIALALGLVDAESYVVIELAEYWPRVFGVGPEGARGMLTAIASSMITVAGVVFSVTIVALSLAASQYSPRILRTFSSDRPTQLVLGVFVAIFAYCLVVLRTIRGGDDGYVPSLAVLGGLVLALVGTGVLIFFIHHLAAAIQPSSILARISAATLDVVDALFPEEIGVPAEDEEIDEAEPSQREWTEVMAPTTGYLTSVDESGLLEFARKSNRVVRMEAGIGAFVIANRPLVSLSGAQAVTTEDVDAVARNYSFDRQRTLEQDATFGLQQIVDIGSKALSPGVNDASTAILCIDRLTEILARLAGRRIESRFRAADGALRVVACRPDFADFAHVTYGALRTDARGNASVLKQLVWSLEQIAAVSRSATRRGVVAEQVARTVQTFAQLGVLTAEQTEVKERAEALSREIAFGSKQR